MWKSQHPLLCNPCSFVGFGLVFFFKLGRQTKVLWQIKCSSEILTVSVGIEKKKGTAPGDAVLGATVRSAGLPMATVACGVVTRVQAQTFKSLTQEMRRLLQGSLWRRGHRGLTSGEGSEGHPQQGPLFTEPVRGCPSPRTSPSSPQELGPVLQAAQVCTCPAECGASARPPWEGPHRLVFRERK